MPTGKYRPERPKPTSALLKQNPESLKMAIQSILPPNDTPPANLMSTDDDLAVTSEDIQSVAEMGGLQKITEELEMGTAVTLDQHSGIAWRSPELAVNDKSAGGFEQLKPPTTTGRVQSAGVKNFFIRKGVDKRAPTQSFYTVRTQPAAVETPPSVSPNDKKIIIKSQQIIKVGNLQPNTGSLDAIVNSSTSATDLTDILDLPILFADNDGNLQDQGAIAATPTVGGDVHIEQPDATSTPTTNILITSPDGKLPNRPVVISAANVSKLAKPSAANAVTLKLIFSGDRLNSLNNRDENLSKADLKTMPPLKLTQTQYRELQERHNLKPMPPLKLTPTTQAATTSLAGAGAFTKLAPGTKIDLSTLKIVKSGASPTTTGNIAFKTGIQHRDTPKGTIVFKPAGTTSGLQSHQVLKSGILNRNITVRKVVSLIPGPKSTNSASVPTSAVEAVVSSPPTSTSTSSATVAPTSPSATPSVDPETAK